MSIFHEDTSLRSNLQFFDDKQVFSAYHLYFVPSQWQEANQADKEHVHSYLLMFLTSTVTMTGEYSD